jgi:GNAT superfamily N-acetyltransferase
MSQQSVSGSLPAAAIIRPARADDLPAIVPMRNRLNELELAGCPHAAIVPLTLDEFAAIWGPTLDLPTHCWRVVEAAGRPVGYGLIYLASPRTVPPGAFLHWAYLEEVYRSSGLGRQLVQTMLDWAVAQGANRIELQYIDGNVVGERFWIRMGFRPYARKCVYYPAERKT